MEQQGYPLSKNILFQDNKSAILLENNSKRSAGKRSRALNVRYFFLTDQVKKGNLTIEYCPTDVMWADFMTKPLQGEKFRKFRDDILGISWKNGLNRYKSASKSVTRLKRVICTDFGAVPVENTVWISICFKWVFVIRSKNVLRTLYRISIKKEDILYANTCYHACRARARSTDESTPK